MATLERIFHFEHVPYNEVPTLLATLMKRTSKLLLIVPLGENNQYRVLDYEDDKTHIIRENEEWWLNTVKDAGFKVFKTSYYLKGLKDNWYNINPKGNMIILVER